MRASVVYHTHSDFSLSAVRWSASVDTSFTLRGVDEQGELRLDPDSTPSEKTVRRLVDRTDDELNHCRVLSSGPEINADMGIGGALDLDDEYNDDIARVGH